MVNFVWFGDYIFFLKKKALCNCVCYAECMWAPLTSEASVPTSTHWYFLFPVVRRQWWMYPRSSFSLLISENWSLFWFAAYFLIKLLICKYFFSFIYCLTLEQKKRNYNFCFSFLFKIYSCVLASWSRSLHLSTFAFLKRKICLSANPAAVSW